MRRAGGRPAYVQSIAHRRQCHVNLSRQLMSSAKGKKTKKGKEANGGGDGGGSEDGDIGNLKREFRRRKQAHERKRRAKPAAASATAVDNDDQQSAATDPPASGKAATKATTKKKQQQDGARMPPAAYQAKCQQLKHMDELAEMVYNQLKVLSPDAEITKEAAYELAEMARNSALYMLNMATEFTENGPGAPEAPITHGDMLVGVNGWLPESLNKVLIYRAMAEIGAQQDTLEAGRNAFVKYTEIAAVN